MERTTVLINYLLVMSLAILFAMCCSPNNSAISEANNNTGVLWGVKIISIDQKYQIVHENEKLNVYGLDSIVPCQDTKAFIIGRDGKIGAALLDKDTMTVIPVIFDDLFFDVKESIWETNIDGKWGLYSNSGEQLIEPTFEKIDFLSNGIAVISSSSPASFFSIYEDELYITDWDEIYSFQEDYAIVKKNDMFGYIDCKNNNIIECKFIEAYPFSNGIAWVLCEDEEYYAIDKNGNVKFKIDGYPLTDFNSYGCAIIQDANSEKCGIINTEGEYLVPKDTWYVEEAEFDENGYFVASENGYTWGIINSFGKTVVPCICDIEYRYMLQYFDNMVVFKTNSSNEYCIYDIEGNLVASFIASTTYIPSHYSCNLLRVDLENGGIAYYNLNGIKAFVTDKQLMYMDDFSDALCRVCKNKKWGFINDSGALVIPAVFSSAENFINGFAIVTIDEECYIINELGDVVLKVQ